MKKILIPVFLVLISLRVSAQENFSGAYGYSIKPHNNSGNHKEATWPSGYLVLLKMENNTYRFWLDVTIGWPNYNSGRAIGAISFVDDTASFDNSIDGAGSPCILHFRKSGSVITIHSLSYSFNCGFGNAVHADGEYARLKDQPVLNYDWLKKQYDRPPSLIVTAKKAELFQDKGGVRPFPDPSYFVKGESLLNVSETDKTVYTEFITASGKFIYGWIKKTDLKIIDGK